MIFELNQKEMASGFCVRSRKKLVPFSQNCVTILRIMREEQFSKLRVVVRSDLSIRGIPVKKAPISKKAPPI